jgi:superfamily II DNA or RNA helicase
MDVQEVPYSRTRKPLGEGVVLEIRQIGGRDQVLVDYLQAGQRIWVPYENLRAIDGVRQKFFLGRTGNADQAERFRLKSLAYALDLWNQNTGSLSRLEIDPLPHQIHLVHHILASGNLNWLIADDVGLGKTIEVGMLLAALQQRGQFRRILLVTPAGLVRQWQEELHHKFGMSDFQIYGTDFFINDPRHWKMHDRVIGSIDRLKSEEHLEILMQAGAWDLIVFDEAHRLSRRQWGNRLDASQRFALAATLRHKTDAMLLLTATPHQGMQDKFQAILELLRPEVKEQIDSLSLHPQMLRDLVIRNRKADVTDSEGNFIFKAKTTRAVQVELGVEEERFQRLLTRSTRQGNWLRYDDLPKARRIQHCRD